MFTQADMLQAVEDLVTAANLAAVADDWDAAEREVSMALRHALVVWGHDCPTAAGVRDALRDVVAEILQTERALRGRQ